MADDCGLKAEVKEAYESGDFENLKEIIHDWIIQDVPSDMPLFRQVDWDCVRHSVGKLSEQRIQEVIEGAYLFGLVNGRSTPEMSMPFTEGGE